MNERDDELDALLTPLKKAQLTATQMAAWQIAVQAELRSGPLRSFVKSRAVQMVAAAFVGFLVGAALFRAGALNLGGEDLFASGDATYEHSHVNLD